MPTEEAKHCRQRLEHLIWPELAQGWREGLFDSRFVLKASWEHGKELEVLPAELATALSGVQVAPKARGYATPGTGASEAHLDVGEAMDLEEVQHL